MDDSQRDALRAPFTSAQIGQIPRKTKTGGTVYLDYVGHAATTDRLLKVDPDWNWEPAAFNEAGAPLITVRDGRCVMWIRLTVCGVTRLGVGTVDAGAAEPEKELIGDAIRNAAMRFGVALDLWAKEDLSDPEPPDELAENRADLVARMKAIMGHEQGPDLLRAEWATAGLPKSRDISDIETMIRAFEVCEFVEGALTAQAEKPF